MHKLVLSLAAVAGLLTPSLGHAQSAPSPGDITTVVMNMEHGGAAVGMTVELYDLSGDKPRKVAERMTAQDGMAALIASGPLQIGQYELRFQVGDYFRRMNVPVGKTAFLDFVPIRFSITDPAGHYHVPLICTPWGYTTYRGT